jgi:hypothetical protein
VDRRISIDHAEVMQVRRESVSCGVKDGNTTNPQPASSHTHMHKTLVWN